MYLLLIIWAYLHFACPFGVNSEGVLAITTYGEVKGQKKISRNGRLFHSFTGIRYAKAPIGELRFQVSNNTRNNNEALISSVIFLRHLKNPTRGILPKMPPKNPLYASNAIIYSPVIRQ